MQSSNNLGLDAPTLTLELAPGVRKPAALSRGEMMKGPFPETAELVWIQALPGVNNVFLGKEFNLSMHLLSYLMIRKTPHLLTKL